MPLEFSENDWKVLRDLREELIDKFCDETLQRVQKLVSEKKDGNLKTYQKVYRYVEKREHILVDKLNDFRRSNAIRKIFGLYQIGLLDDQDLSKFSDSLRSIIMMHQKPK